MIVRPADFQELALLVADNSANIRVGLRSDQIRQCRLAVPRAEHDVIDEARVSCLTWLGTPVSPLRGWLVFVLPFLGLTPQAIAFRRSAARRAYFPSSFPGVAFAASTCVEVGFSWTGAGSETLGSSTFNWRQTAANRCGDFPHDLRGVVHVVDVVSLGQQVQVVAQVADLRDELGGAGRPAAWPRFPPWPAWPGARAGPPAG